MLDFLGKNLTLIKALYSQHFENQAIVLSKTTNEYFQYLFAPWHRSRSKIVKHGHWTGCPGAVKHRDVRERPNSAAVYVRHWPETTLLYQIVNEYWHEFQAELASQDKYLPAYVTQEFEAYLKCGRLEHGFLRVRCETCHAEKLVAFSCKRRGFCGRP